MTAKWRVTGTRRGKPKVVFVRASSWAEAVRAATFAPHMLVTNSCVLIDDRSEETRLKAIAAYKALRA